MCSNLSRNFILLFVLMSSVDYVVTSNGQWGLWSAWSSCTKTCGYDGYMTRTRQCNSPAPANGGSNCQGDTTGTNVQQQATTSCSQYPCPVVSVNGQWGPWTVWYRCTQTCGYNGYKYRQRYCNNPTPTNGGMECPGDTNRDNFEEERNNSCSQFPCPVNGMWSSWASTGICSVTCGYGTITRSRQCNDPTPSTDGLYCQGSATDSVSCNNKNCPVNGMWSSWTLTGICSVTCGYGTITRSRQCNNPTPSTDGMYCQGSATDYVSCNNRNCPVNGIWSAWSSTGRCSITCGGGTVTHTRQCNNPLPSNGGLNCKGNDTEYKPCGEEKCPGIHAN